MKKNGKKTSYFVWYRLFYVLLLICVGLLGAGGLLGIKEISFWHLLVGIVCGFIFVGINSVTGRDKLLFIVSLLGISILFLLIVDKKSLQEFCFSYLNWAGGKAGWNEAWAVGYGCIQSVLLAGGCYIFWRIAEWFPVIKKVSAATVFLGLLVCMFRKIELSHIGVAVSICYVMMIYVETQEERWKKVKEHEDGHYMIWLLPFFAFYFFLCCAMPMSEKPYDWGFIKTAYHTVKEAAITQFQNVTRNGKEDFGLAVSGFSEDGRLGSGFIDDDRILMEINGKGGLVTNIYLIGKIYDTFDGKGWEQVATGDTKDRYLDDLETLYAVERYDTGRAADYVSQTELTLRYDYLDTGYVFAPLKTYQMINCEPLCDGTNLKFEEQKGYGTEYRVVFHQLNVDHPAFYEMIEAEKKPNEEIWNQLTRRYTPEGQKQYTLVDLEAHRDYVYQHYAKKPVVSKEIENYLMQITTGAKTDLEKVRAIEAELSSYTYTKMPGKIPRKVQDANSYLEYFLLESKKGYCSYYATAFVLLARAEGIPARYVEGFCVPTNKERKMTVYSNMTHAWPEVYLDGIGWIPFEPTPGYEEIRYTPWKVIGQREEVLGHPPLMAVQENIPKIEDMNVEETENKQVMTGQQKHIFIVGVIGIVIVLLLMLLFDYLLGRYRYKNMEISKQFLAEFRKNMWVLSQYGLTRKEAETMQEFRTRMVQPSFYLPDCEYAFIICYEEIVYAGKQTTEADIELVKKERQILLQQMKEKKKRRYYYMKLRLLRY